MQSRLWVQPIQIERTQTLGPWVCDYMGAAGNGAFAGEHRAGRKVGMIGECHGTFRKDK